MISTTMTAMLESEAYKSASTFSRAPILRFPMMKAVYKLCLLVHKKFAT